jgi:Holliday junction resolvasome RuvABC endonuclease subunit
MRTLALDLGTTTGWAFSTGTQIISGTQNNKNDRFSGGGMRYLRFRNWLDEVNRDGSLGAVYYEEVRRHIGVDAAHVYGGYLATLTSWCESNRIPYEGVPVGTIKKHVTGKGNANKALVMQAMVDKGHSPCDDNEADALALLYTMLESNP